jgi:hypothetical protein
VIVTDILEEPFSPIVGAAQRYWDGISSAGLPSKRAIRPQSMPALLPHILWYDVLRDPLDFRYRLIGTAVRPHLGMNRTGQVMSAVPGQGPGSAVWQHLAAAVQERRATRRAPPFVGPGCDFLEIENLVCPLSDDGETVDGLLIFVDFVRRRDPATSAKVVKAGARP